VSTQLVEAIRQLNLKPGQTYTVEVDGRAIDITPAASPRRELYEVQEMLVPWFDSPDPSGGVTITLTVGPPERPAPYRLDENDLAPGTLEEVRNDLRTDDA
jgi:hypothetical protein